MNMGAADRLILDPITLSAYNKIAHAKERIMLAGSAQEATGAHFVLNGPQALLFPSKLHVSCLVRLVLHGLVPVALLLQLVPAFADAGAAGSLLQAGTYTYYVTAVSINGESLPSPSASQAVTAGDKVTVTITAVSGAQYYNVYRSDLGGSAALLSSSVVSLRALETRSSLTLATVNLVLSLVS